MLKLKRKVIVPEGEVKEELLDAIAAWQASPTIRTQEALWDLVSEKYPQFHKKAAHFSYCPTTKVLFLKRGISSRSWFPITT